MPLETLLNAVLLIALGAAALFFGLRLFWLFAAVVGFAVGWWLVGLFFKDLGLLQVIIGVIVGMILAGLTRALGKWAIRIVAGLAGFVMLPLLLGNLGMLGGLSEFNRPVEIAGIGQCHGCHAVLLRQADDGLR